MSEILVSLNGAVQWRFTPFREDADEIVTQRAPQHPPVPIGAELYRGGELLGTVRCVRREPFDRWAVVYTPAVDGRQPTVDGEDEDTAEGEVPVNNEGNISQEIIGPQYGPTGTPIAALAEHLDPRVFGTLEQLAGTVEELSGKTDEALRAIDGIGPKRLKEIREACAKALNG